MFEKVSFLPPPWRSAHLPVHLLLLRRVDLDVFAERTGIRVALSAARDLTGIWFL